MALHRTHILLETEQIDQLKEIARREDRSVSEVARTIIQDYLDVQTAEAELQRRLQALERIRENRAKILVRRGGTPLKVDVVELIRQMRDERDDEILKAGSSDRD